MLGFDELKPKVEAHEEVNQKQEFKFIGSVNLQKGMTLFEFNPETLLLQEVKIEKKVSIGLKGQEVRTNKANYNPKCIYLQALNLKNAKRKVLKHIERLENENLGN